MGFQSDSVKKKILKKASQNRLNRANNKAKEYNGGKLNKTQQSYVAGDVKSSASTRAYGYKTDGLPDISFFDIGAKSYNSYQNQQKGLDPYEVRYVNDGGKYYVAGEKQEDGSWRPGFYSNKRYLNKDEEKVYKYTGGLDRKKYERDYMYSTFEEKDNKTNDFRNNLNYIRNGKFITDGLRVASNRVKKGDTKLEYIKGLSKDMLVDPALDLLKVFDYYESAGSGLFAGALENSADLFEAVADNNIKIKDQVDFARPFKNAKESFDHSVKTGWGKFGYDIVSDMVKRDDEQEIRNLNNNKDFSDEYKQKYIKELLAKQDDPSHKAFKVGAGLALDITNPFQVGTAISRSIGKAGKNSIDAVKDMANGTGDISTGFKAGGDIGDDISKMTLKQRDMMARMKAYKSYLEEEYMPMIKKLGKKFNEKEATELFEDSAHAQKYADEIGYTANNVDQSINHLLDNGYTNALTNDKTVGSTIGETNSLANGVTNGSTNGTTNVEQIIANNPLTQNIKKFLDDINPIKGKQTNIDGRTLNKKYTQTKDGYVPSLINKVDDVVEQNPSNQINGQLNLLDEVDRLSQPSIIKNASEESYFKTLTGSDDIDSLIETVNKMPVEKADRFYDWLEVNNPNLFYKINEPVNLDIANQLDDVFLNKIVNNASKDVEPKKVSEFDFKGNNNKGGKEEIDELVTNYNKLNAERLSAPDIKVPTRPKYSELKNSFSDFANNVNKQVASGDNTFLGKVDTLLKKIDVKKLSKDDVYRGQIAEIINKELFGYDFISSSVTKGNLKTFVEHLDDVLNYNITKQNKLHSFKPKRSYNGTKKGVHYMTGRTGRPNEIKLDSSFFSPSLLDDLYYDKVNFANKLIGIENKSEIEEPLKALEKVIKKHGEKMLTGKDKEYQKLVKQGKGSENLQKMLDEKIMQLGLSKLSPSEQKAYKSLKSRFDIREKAYKEIKKLDHDEFMKVKNEKSGANNVEDIIEKTKKNFFDDDEFLRKEIAQEKALGGDGSEAIKRQKARYEKNNNPQSQSKKNMYRAEGETEAKTVALEEKAKSKILSDLKAESVYYKDFENIPKGKKLTFTQFSKHKQGRKALKNIKKLTDKIIEIESNVGVKSSRINSFEHKVYNESLKNITNNLKRYGIDESVWRKQLDDYIEFRTKSSQHIKTDTLSPLERAGLTINKKHGVSGSKNNPPYMKELHLENKFKDNFFIDEYEKSLNSLHPKDLLNSNHKPIYEGDTALHGDDIGNELNASKSNGKLNSFLDSIRTKLSQSDLSDEAIETILESKTKRYLSKNGVSEINNPLYKNFKINKGSLPSRSAKRLDDGNVIDKTTGQLKYSKSNNGDLKNIVKDNKYYHANQEENKLIEKLLTNPDAKSEHFMGLFDRMNIPYDITDEKSLEKAFKRFDWIVQKKVKEGSINFNPSSSSRSYNIENLKEFEKSPLNVLTEKLSEAKKYNDETSSKYFEKLIHDRGTNEIISEIKKADNIRDKEELYKRLMQQSEYAYDENNGLKYYEEMSDWLMNQGGLDIREKNAIIDFMKREQIKLANKGINPNIEVNQNTIESLQKSTYNTQVNKDVETASKNSVLDKVIKETQSKPHEDILDKMVNNIIKESDNLEKPYLDKITSEKEYLELVDKLKNNLNRLDKEELYKRLMQQSEYAYDESNGLKYYEEMSDWLMNKGGLDVREKNAIIDLMKKEQLKLANKGIDPNIEANQETIESLRKSTYDARVNEDFNIADAKNTDLKNIIEKEKNRKVNQKVLDKFEEPSNIFEKITGKNTSKPKSESKPKSTNPKVNEPTSTKNVPPKKTKNLTKEQEERLNGDLSLKNIGESIDDDLTAFERQVAKENSSITKTKDFFKDKSNPKMGYEDNKVYDVYKRWLNTWKKGLTVYNPGWHVQNFFQNKGQNYLAFGTEAFGSQKNARNMLKHIQGLPNKAGDLVSKNGRVYTPGEIQDLSKKLGVVNSHTNDIMSARGIFSGLENTIDNSTIMKRLGRSEDTSRLFHFMKQLEKGMSPEDASKSVNKYLFDYANKSKSDKIISDFIDPFWMFHKNYARLLGGEAIKNPSKMGNILRAERSLDGPTKENERNRSIDNRFQAPGLSYKDETNGATYDYMYKQNLFPRLQETLPTDTEEFENKLNPIVKILLQQQRGEGNFGNKIVDGEAGWDEVSKSDRNLEMLKELNPIGSPLVKTYDKISNQEKSYYAGKIGEETYDKKTMQALLQYLLGNKADYYKR